MATTSGGRADSGRYDATNGQDVPNPDPNDPDPVHGRFIAEASAMHDRTNGMRDHAGDPQLPWPKALGTTPGAVANEMNGAGGAGTPGTTCTFSRSDFVGNSLDLGGWKQAWADVVPA